MSPRSAFRVPEKLKCRQIRGVLKQRRIGKSRARKLLLVVVGQSETHTNCRSQSHNVKTYKRFTTPGFLSGFSDVTLWADESPTAQNHRTRTLHGPQPPLTRPLSTPFTPDPIPYEAVPSPWRDRHIVRSKSWRHLLLSSSAYTYVNL